MEGGLGRRGGGKVSHQFLKFWGSIAFQAKIYPQLVENKGGKGSRTIGHFLNRTKFYYRTAYLIDQWDSCHVSVTTSYWVFLNSENTHTHTQNSKTLKTLTMILDTVMNIFRWSPWMKSHVPLYCPKDQIGSGSQLFAVCLYVMTCISWLPFWTHNGDRNPPGWSPAWHSPDQYTATRPWVNKQVWWDSREPHCCHTV